MIVDTLLTTLRAFDVELLYVAQQLNMPVAEVAVNWQEIDGQWRRGCRELN